AAPLPVGAASSGADAYAPPPSAGLDASSGGAPDGPAPTLVRGDASSQVPDATPALDGSSPAPDDARASDDAVVQAAPVDAGPIRSIQSGVTWLDDKGNPVNAHGGGVVREGDRFYFYGESFSGGTNTFKAFAMYSSPDLMNWTFERNILTTQTSGPLGPNRVGERPHILKCPATGEYILVAHAADPTYQVDKEVVFATSPTINGQYMFAGILANAVGAPINHSDIGAYQDATAGYVVTEGGASYKMTPDCHGWTTVSQAAAFSGTESPTVFAIGSTHYWLWSHKTGWTSNDNEYGVAPTMDGPWVGQGLLAPAGQTTWNSQRTFVLPVTGTSGTTYVYGGDRWNARDNSKATYVWQPLVVTNSALSMPTYYPSWTIDVARGAWSC
ncbi:MAG: hypothetical protein M3O50_10570, partial [Myxococcota bacterium]|nr:hypothetical protein [Myxococcota bacterium]